MNPRDYALEIEPNASPERLFNIEQILHKFAADELCKAGIEIDDADRQRRIRFPGEASSICRNKADEHLRYTDPKAERTRRERAALEALKTWRKEGLESDREFDFRIEPLLDAADALIEFEARYWNGAGK